MLNMSVTMYITGMEQSFGRDAVSKGAKQEPNPSAVGNWADNEPEEEGVPDVRNWFVKRSDAR